MGNDSTGGTGSGKKQIRSLALKRRSSLLENDRCKRSKIICEKFVSLDIYKNADTILLYKAYNCEVDTDFIFERAVSDNKTVAYPASKMTENGPEMVFYEIKDLKNLVKGYKGIMEPDTEDVNEVKKVSKEQACRQNCVCVLPGAAFDKYGHRIGYGMGFYDRFLHDHRPYKTVGLAFDIQIYDEILTDPYDVAVDMVITDTKIYE